MAHYWQNKVCLVTGSSAGLGAAIGRALARNGANVILTARRKEPLEATAAELRSGGGEIVAEQADVTWQAAVDRLAAMVQEQFGRLDLLCNCAGRSTRGPVLDTTPEDFQQLLDVNFLATVRTTLAFAEMLLASGGHLVNIGSLASKAAPRYMGAYPASKFALAAYTQQLRLELGPRGVHAMLVCPGPIARTGDALPASGRYAATATNVPAASQAPGGGARVATIDPDALAEKILSACERRAPELVVPAKVKLLFSIAQLSASWGDRLLKRYMRE